jgi:hypothetical protein
MSTPTGGANSPLLPDATPYLNVEVLALAAEFEVAWAAEGVIFKSSSTDAEAAVARVREIAQKIVVLPATDVPTMRLKARVYLWSESTDFETFAAENEGNGWSESVLVSLFRDLGADRALDYSSVEEATR